MPTTSVAIFFLLGTVIGSFLNVVALRSLSGESILWPPSHCPLCGHRLAARDLIPLVSYLALRGRCRYCGGRISPQYPLVEAATGVVFAALSVRYGMTVEFLRFAVFASTLIAVTVTDIKEMTVPYAPLVLAIAGMIVLKLIGGYGIEVLGDIVAAVIFVLGTALLCKWGSVGDGDVPVGALIIITFNPKQAVTVFIIAAVVGGIYGGILLVKDSQNRKRPIPLVPFLAANSVVVAIWPVIAERLFWWWS
ncbi:MAG: prepilin peptidase [Moorellaceae bacterium]